MITKFLSVRNWGDLQHYKDRTPPWIKLYNQLLDDFEFSCLPDASKAHLLSIWLLASRTGNKIPNDSRWISNKINATESVDLKLLISYGFLVEEPSTEAPHQLMEHDASMMLQNAEHNACLEREKRQSRERVEKEKPEEQPMADMPANADTDQVITVEDHQEQQARKPTTDNRVIEIFHYWCDVMRKNRLTAKMTPKRTKAIRDRLKQGYTMDDIKLAIYNCSQDPWSMGNNDRQKPFNDIELICRNGEKLESYLDAVQKKAAARNVNSIGTDFSPPKGWNT